MHLAALISALKDVADAAQLNGFGNTEGLIRRTIRDLAAINPAEFDACVPKAEEDPEPEAPAE